MADEHGTEGQPFMIPKARLDEVSSKYKEETAKRERAERNLEAMMKRFTDLETEHKAFVVKAETDRILSKEGVEDEILADYVRFSYERVTPEEGKERTPFKDWVKGFKESNAAMFGGLPKAPADPAPGAPGALPPPAAPGAPPAPPKVGEHTVIQSKGPPGAKLTPHEISKMSMDEFKAYQSVLLGKGPAAPAADPPAAPPAS